MDVTWMAATFPKRGLSGRRSARQRQRHERHSSWKSLNSQPFFLLLQSAEAFVAPVAVPWISPKHSGTKNCICTTPSPCSMGNGATKLFIAVSPMQAGVAYSKFAEFLEKMKLGLENPKFVRRIFEMFGHGTMQGAELVADQNVLVKSISGQTWIAVIQPFGCSQVPQATKTRPLASFSSWNPWFRASHFVNGCF